MMFEVSVPLCYCKDRSVSIYLCTVAYHYQSTQLCEQDKFSVIGKQLQLKSETQAYWFKTKWDQKNVHCLIDILALEAYFSIVLWTVNTPQHIVFRSSNQKRYHT